MANFHDRMKSFTDRLQTSIEDRETALAHVHQATVDLLGGARMFMNNVAQDHQTMAEELNQFLSDTRSDREETVAQMRENHREFLDEVSAQHEQRAEDVDEFLSNSRSNRMETVGAMREAHCEQLDAMREKLRENLDEANKARLEAVEALTDAFRTARLDLAADLHQAAMSWRMFASHGRTPMLESKPRKSASEETKVVHSPTKAASHAPKVESRTKKSKAKTSSSAAATLTKTSRPVAKSNHSTTAAKKRKTR